MIFLTPAWIIAFVFAFVFYGAGKRDPTVRDGADLSMLWAGISIAISALVIQVFSGGWILVVIAQVALFVGIGVFRAFRDR